MFPALAMLLERHCRSIAADRDRLIAEAIAGVDARVSAAICLAQQLAELAKRPRRSKRASDLATREAARGRKPRIIQTDKRLGTSKSE